MNETKKPDVQQEELNIVSTPEEAVDATTIEQIEQNSNEEETPEVETEVASVAEEASAKPESRQEIIGRLSVIAEGEYANGNRNEVEALKVQFYRIRTAEIEAEMKEFVAQGGDEALFIPKEDGLEEAFKSHMATIKAKRNAWLAAQEEEMKANYEEKVRLLEQLQALVEKASQGTPEVNEFKAVQAKWKEIRKTLKQP
jgi:hypothetical protein